MPGWGTAHGGGGAVVEGGLKLHVEISICACLAKEEAGAGNNCHSPQRLRLRTVRVCLCVCVMVRERVMDSGRLIINLVSWREWRKRGRGGEDWLGLYFFRSSLNEWGVGSSPQRGLIKRGMQCDGGKGELTPTRLLGKCWYGSSSPRPAASSWSLLMNNRWQERVNGGDACKSPPHSHTDL